jgi:hypothetical protein
MDCCANINIKNTGKLFEVNFMVPNNAVLKDKTTAEPENEETPT